MLHALIKVSYWLYWFVKKPAKFANIKKVQPYENTSKWRALTFSRKCKKKHEVST